MDSIRIQSGEKRLLVNDDPSRVIVFNPNDETFAERFYAVVSEFDAKQLDFQSRYEQLEADTGTDANGLPANTAGKLALVREACLYFREKIDAVFGAGTSQAAFGDALELELFGQFFDGITPYIRAARAGKINKYLAAAPAKPKQPRPKHPKAR